eukprot:10110478-Ditylum_brightwellii.AAC.1
MPHQRTMLFSASKESIDEEAQKSRQRRRSRGRVTTYYTERTAYQILNCATNATYAELRRSYIALARQYHPDATIGKSDVDEEFSSDKFSEIATAWKTLADPKERRRYDRTIQADAFADDMEKIATQLSKAAIPTLGKLFENVALPFIEKASASTAKSVKYAAREISNNMNKSDAPKP